MCKLNLNMDGSPSWYGCASPPSKVPLILGVLYAAGVILFATVHTGFFCCKNRTCCFGHWPQDLAEGNADDLCPKGFCNTVACVLFWPVGVIAVFCCCLVCTGERRYRDDGRYVLVRV